MAGVLRISCACPALRGGQVLLSTTYSTYHPPTINSSVKQALLPEARPYTVAAIIVCHFILISIIILLYLSGGDNGDILGQAWVAVNQLQNEEALLIRQSSAAVMDGDVKRMLKENGIAHRKVGLVDHGGQGHVIGSLQE